jgi:hypothetical protein
VASAVLTNYAKVVWMLGEESTVDETFSSAEQTAVTGYLNAGGRLMVSGAEIGWDLGRSGQPDGGGCEFFTNVLRAAYSADSGGTGLVTGTAGGFLNGVSIAFNYTNLLSDIYAANYPDVLRTGSGAVTAAVYGASAGGTSGAIIQYSNATYRTIVMGFPFETITNETTRATVMTKAMQFLGDSTTPGAIRVTLSPTAVTNTARWMVAGTTNTSGSTRTGPESGHLSGDLLCRRRVRHAGGHVGRGLGGRHQCIHDHLCVRLRIADGDPAAVHGSGRRPLERGWRFDLAHERVHAVRG